ncbi:MAG TPA: hypothetical protein VGQ04_00265 [Chitinophagaceae bacterium]|jgi:hypothetical protein|nr:hypothetical protein [Chitinophagaceae bacterium]
MSKALLVLLFIPLFSFRPYDDCGIYRWDYKVLVDPTGWPLLNIATKSKTIYNLNRLPRPATLGNQRTPYEKWKVTVTGWLVMLGSEDDRDYHLVLTNTNRTDSLIAEIPDSSCTKLDHFPALREKYGTARTYVNEKIEIPNGSVEELTTAIKVQVTGFLFFDKMAHGNGHAKNGIEIHPVIAVKLAN